MKNNELEILNQEYKALVNSKEYTTGRTVLKIRYYLKRFKFITLLKLLLNSRYKKKYVFNKDNYANDKLFINNEDNMIKEYDKNERLAIYTVIIGKYDNLTQPLFTSDKVDYYVVSDIKPNNLGVWKWIDANQFLPNIELTNVKKARFIKTHPHLIFKDYKYSMFIDGNIRCITDVTSFIERINNKTKMAIHLHPYRDCIYKEAVSCKYTKKGNYETIKKQIIEYQNEGMPSEFGLFETGVIVREHNDPVCIDIMEAWWNEICNKSERDQLSLTYVLWKRGFVSNDIGIIYETIKDNPKLLLVNHVQIYDK